MSSCGRSSAAGDIGVRPGAEPLRVGTVDGSSGVVWGVLVSAGRLETSRVGGSGTGAVGRTGVRSEREPKPPVFRPIRVGSMRGGVGGLGTRKVVGASGSSMVASASDRSGGGGVGTGPREPLPGKLRGTMPPAPGPATPGAAVTGAWAVFSEIERGLAVSAGRPHGDGGPPCAQSSWGGTGAAEGVSGTLGGRTGGAGRSTS